MKTKIVLLVVLLISLIIYSCGKEINSPKSNVIEFLSFQSNGCISTSKESDAEKISDVAIIETNYVNGELAVNIKFRTHCSAVMQDSVNVGDKRIDIYLRDINTDGSRCICQRSEEFTFSLNDEEEIEIIFSYDPYAAEGYYTLADTTIQIK